MFCRIVDPSQLHNATQNIQNLQWYQEMRILFVKAIFNQIQINAIPISNAFSFLINNMSKKS